MHDPGPTAESPNAEGPEAGGNATQQLEALGVPNTEPQAYAASSIGEPLWCCEILSEVVQHRQSLRSLREAEPELESIVHPFCIVVSQDCDLEQDFRIRQSGGSLPPGIVGDRTKGRRPAREGHLETNHSKQR